MLSPYRPGCHYRRMCSVRCMCCSVRSFRTALVRQWLLCLQPTRARTLCVYVIHLRLWLVFDFAVMMMLLSSFYGGAACPGYECTSADTACKHCLRPIAAHGIDVSSTF